MLQGRAHGLASEVRVRLPSAVILRSSRRSVPESLSLSEPAARARTRILETAFAVAARRRASRGATAEPDPNGRLVRKLQPRYSADLRKIVRKPQITWSQGCTTSFEVDWLK
eukprot:5287021-Prymnesium_polylepis.1